MRRLSRTPRTALTWATLDEWLGCAWRIKRRRPSALRNRQAMLDVRALPLDTSSAAGEYGLSRLRGNGAFQSGVRSPSGRRMASRLPATAASSQDAGPSTPTKLPRR